MGAKGAKGHPMPDWLEKRSGEPGDPGLPGEPGFSNNKGDPGKVGDEGFKGYPGPRGDPGIVQRGLKGFEGYPGDVGLVGDTGPRGPDGKTGLPGFLVSYSAPLTIPIVVKKPIKLCFLRTGAQGAERHARFSRRGNNTRADRDARGLWPER